MTWHKLAGFLPLVLLAAGSACEGSGSDIGPEIRSPILPNYRVLVQDDQNRAVTSALVSIQGVTEAAATNRYGRASVLTVPSGVRRLYVDGTSASATSSSRLAALGVTAAMPDGDELPYVVYLPDTSNSATLTLSVGTPPPIPPFDDSANSGAKITFDPVTTVGGPPGANEVELRAGGLARGHLPGELPKPTTGVRLWDAGVYVDPPGVTFSPGAALSMPNTGLNLPDGATADLYHLDDFTGIWQRVGSGTVNGVDDRIEAPGSVLTGGLYAFATTVTQSATLTGRVVNHLGRPVYGALVRALGQHTRTLGDGGFVLPPIPAVDGAGTPLVVTLDVHGGRDWRASHVATLVTLQPGPLSAGDIVLETLRVSDIRLQLISQGKIDPYRRLRLAVSLGNDVGVGVGDAQGTINYDDIATGGFAGVLTTRLGDPGRVLAAEGWRFFSNGIRRLDLQVFSLNQEIHIHRSSEGNTAVHVVDAIGTGPVEGAALVSGVVPGNGFTGWTLQNGIIYGEFGYASQVTASVATTASGLAVTSAYTLVDLDSRRIEIPLLRAVARANGGFDRHGLVRGQLVDASSSPKSRMLRSTRYIALEDWYEEVFDGQSVMGNVPFVVDPAVTGQPVFTVGVTEPTGHLAAVEGTTETGDFVLERMGIAANVVPFPGSKKERDIALDLVADTQFDAPGAIKNLDPATSSSDLTFDLAVELADNTLVDVARGIGGASITPTGVDAEFKLPSLSGSLSGGSYYVALHGGYAAGGKTVKQSTFIPFDDPSGPRVEFLGVPDITSPAPGATVSSNGFTVNFTVPNDVLYTVVRLRASGDTEVRDWTAVLPHYETSFSFRTLPPQAAQPLQAGHTWTLSVTVARVQSGPLAGGYPVYRTLLQNFVGIGPSERQVNAYSSTSIQVTTN